MNIQALKDALWEIEAEVLCSSCASPIALSRTKERFEDLEKEFARSLGDLTIDDAKAIVEGTTRIQLVASRFADLDGSFGATFFATAQESDAALQSLGNLRQPRSNDDSRALRTIPPPGSAEALQSHYMRQYFLEHLDDPYPSQDAKNDIVFETNRAIQNHPNFKKIKNTKRGQINDDRLTLWFINARRRSGWQAIKKDLAGDNKERMARLARAYMREQGRPTKEEHQQEKELSVAEHLANPDEDPLSEEVQQRVAKLNEAWETLDLYIRYGIKQKARDWIQDVIKGAKEEKQLEKARKAVQKQRTASTAATKPKAKPKPVAAAAPSAIKANSSSRTKPSTRTSARISRTATQVFVADDSNRTSDGDDYEAPKTARPGLAIFPGGLSRDNVELYTNSLGLGYPSVLAPGPSPTATSRDFSSGSMTSTDSSLLDTTDDQPGRYGASRASSVTSFSSFDEALECLQPETQPATATAAKRIIRPLPAHVRRAPGKTSTITANSPHDFANADSTKLSSDSYPIDSSPTNPQDVHDRFIREQPSDSDCSPVAEPLLLPTASADAYRSVFGYDCFQTMPSCATFGFAGVPA